MSSNNRITETTVVGPPPSTNGKPSANPVERGSPDQVGRGSPDPAHTPDRRSPEAPPSSNGSPALDPSANDRDPLGRFTPGNGGGPGNPFARMVAELRKVAVEAVPREKLRAIFVKMSDLALEGNLQAAKFVTAYTIGKPRPASEPDRMDLQEWQQFKEEAPMMKEVERSAPAPDPVVPLTLARACRYTDTMKRARMLTIVGFPKKEQDRLFELSAANPQELYTLLRDKAKNPNAPPSTNGKRKKHRR